MFRFCAGRCLAALSLAIVSLGIVPMAQASMIAHDQVSYEYDSATMPWEDGSTDSTGEELSDSIVATPSGERFTPEDGFVEWAPSAAGNSASYGVVTFDLDDSNATRYSISSVVVNWVTAGGAAGGFNDPGSFQVAFSADGSTFGEYSAPVAFTSYGGSSPFECPSQAFDVSTLAGSNDAQLVRVKVNCLGGDGGKWFFLTEVGFNGTVVPEPGMFTILSSGVLGLLAYAWRKHR